MEPLFLEQLYGIQTYIVNEFALALAPVVLRMPMALYLLSEGAGLGTRGGV